MSLEPRNVPLDADHWKVAAVESRWEEHLDRPSLRLKGGIATVTEATFHDGSLRFDIAFSGERGFMGGVWRVRDARGYEEFYLRPHQSGKPDANQYTPVFNGVSGWQLYHGKRYSVALTYPFHQWIPVKIAFSGRSAEIYVIDMETPALFISELKREVEAGGVGLSAGNFAPAHFSNFSYTVANAPPLSGKPRSEKDAARGTIRSWWVSEAFREASIATKLTLDDADLEGRSWTRLPCEGSGLANLARVQGIVLGKNTVFARTTIVSKRDQVKKLDFGFSDRVKVYFNGRLLYGGDDTYMSRDYRFLGSIGYFDHLYLPLVEGENELWMAVSEDLGGWGVQAVIEDPTGVTIKES